MDHTHVEGTHSVHKCTQGTRARVSPIVPESEKLVERKLREAVEKRGGKAVKLTSQLHRGLPDRLVLLPGGRAYFVEVKTTGRKPTKLQLAVHRDLRAMGFPVFVIDSIKSLEDFLSLIDHTDGTHEV